MAVAACGSIRPADTAFSRYVDTPGPEAAITVMAGRSSSYRVPRSIYGTFLEPIGDSIWGGVSAQLLDNSSLEPYPASLEVLEKRFGSASFRQSSRFGLPLPWLPLRAAGRRYEMRWDRPANSSAYLYLMGLPGREVGIRQAVYLPAARELAYRGVLFASAEEGAVAVSVGFRGQGRPDDVLAESAVQVPNGRGWVKLPFRLALPAGRAAALQAVDFTVSIKNAGRVSLDEIRLYPADAVGGLDPEVVRRAADLHTPLLRYGGNFSSGYHWRDGIGSIDRRPTRINRAWGIPEYNEFGTDELMDLCRRIGALPQICLNLGSGSAAEARQWVEYCQGPASSAEGRRRVLNGHAEPYPVGAWEFGNELYDDTQLGWYTPERYANRFLEFVRAIEPLVPPRTLLLATGGELGAFRAWNGALLRVAGRELRNITTHLVADLEHTAGAHADRNDVIAADLALPVGVGRALPAIRAQIEAHPATQGRVRLAYTEWMFRSPEGSGLPNYDNMGGAVIAAGWLNMLLLNADWIPVANMTGLMEFGGIHKARGAVYVTPQYWTLYLYSRYAGDRVLATETRTGQYDVHHGQVFAPEIPGAPYLDVVATEDASAATTTLFIVNRDPRRRRPVTVQLTGFRADPEVKIVTLAAASLLDRNDEQHPDRVRPVESRSTMSEDSVRQDLPAGSVTVMRFSRRRP